MAAKCRLSECTARLNARERDGGFVSNRGPISSLPPKERRRIQNRQITAEKTATFGKKTA